MDEKWINVHTHKPGKGINIVDPCLGEVKIPEKGTVYFSMGIHPLYIDGNTGKRLEEIKQLAAGRQLAAIGEAGIDRNAPVTVEMQSYWFQQEAKIAAEYDLPLIIHGVRAIPELISVYKKCSSCQKWIIHGFNNRREILLDLLRHGFYISVGRHVMNEGSHVYELLPEIPDERLFIETDNSDDKIEEIYQKVAVRRGIRIEQLQEIINLNFSKLFRISELYKVRPVR